MGTVKAAGIYARISSDQDGTRAGVERQLADCRQLAERLGWPVAAEYVDNDISAFSGRSRPQFSQFLADITDSTIDAVLVYHLDRLTRRPKELEHFLDILDAAQVSHVRFVTGNMDLGTGDGLLIARIQAAVAANESATKSRRIRRKLDDVAEKGMPHGGGRAFGYEEDHFTIRKDEAKILKLVVVRFLAGETVRSLAAWLNERGVPTANGAQWRSTSLRNVLESPRIAGLRQHRGSVIGQAAWKPIITPTQHEQIRLRFQELASSGRRSPRRYLLSGLLRCAKCGNRLFSSARQGSRRYVCLAGPDHRGCGRLTIVAGPTEELIAEAVLYRLDTPELASALAESASGSTETSALAEAIAADKEQLEELSHLYASRQITAPEWISARNPIESRIDMAERRLARSTNNASLASIVGKGASLRTQWPTLNLARQVAIVRSILDHAVIAPGTPGARQLDPARVNPVWRL